MASGKLTRNDRRFIEKAAESGMEEMALSQIAASRATNPQVREFAQMMVSDHGNANQELTTFATTHGVDMTEMSMKSVNTDKWKKKMRILMKIASGKWFLITEKR